ncbi:MAG: hypothetical protein WBQ08_14955 [Candidatus Sulfotelmatobacter sp.]
MYASRLLVLALLTVCVAPLMAQSPSDDIPGSFYSQPLSALPQDVQANLPLVQVQSPIDIDRLYLPSAKPDSGRAGEQDWKIKAPSLSHNRVLGQNDATCYSIRSYRVTRDDPASDTTRLVGYSTCQSSTRFQVKEADDRQEIKPR